MIYNLTALFSSFIREFIDNPFEEYLSSIPIDITGMFMIIFIISYWPVIMHTLTFGIVGGVYKSGECATIGSLLYLLTFWINTRILKFIIQMIGFLGITPVLVVFLLVCLLEYIGMCKLRNSIIYGF